MINGHISSTLVVSEAKRVVFTAKIRVFIMNKLMRDTVRWSLITNWKCLSHVSILFFWLLSQNSHSTLSNVPFSGNISVHIFFSSFANCLHILVVWFICMLRINRFDKVMVSTCDCDKLYCLFYLINLIIIREWILFAELPLIKGSSCEVACIKNLLLDLFNSIFCSSRALLNFKSYWLVFIMC